MAYKKTVWVEGQTPLSPRNFNNIEEGIESQEAALVSHMADYALHEWLDNVTTTLHNGASGDLERVDERVGGVLRRRTTLGYVDGGLSTVNVKVYACNGVTVEREWTDTLAMPSITRVVIK